LPRQLEKRLNADGSEPHEVLNGAVPGYNASAEAAWFREYGASLSPETVIVAVNLNDHDVTPYLNALGILSTTERSGSFLSPANWSELYLTLRWAALLVKGDPRLTPQDEAPKPTPAGDFNPLDRYISTLRKRFYREPTEPQWGDMQRAWLDLAKRARERRSRLLFVLLPDGDQIGVPEPDLAPQKRLLAFCAAQGLECLDLTPDFAAAAAPGGETLFVDIMHPNDAGHELAAKAIARRLAR
jgi:hypothetical protein